MSEQVFERYSVYYDLLYQDKEYEAEAEYVARTLRAANPDTKTLLEFGSGTGRHGRLLAERGFVVLGIERSESMVGAAREEAEAANQDGRFECIQGDIRTTKVGRTFDAVLALFHVVSYQTADPDVLQTFSNAARHLRRDGIFFFDVWHGLAVLHERPSFREKQAEDEKTRLTRVAKPELDVARCTVTVRYSITAESKVDSQVTKFGEEHCMRYFFPEEIDMFASKTGFTVERSEEFLTGKPPSDGSWGVAYLLRRHTS